MNVENPNESPESCTPENRKKPGLREIKSARMRAALLETTERHIVERGVENLRARDIAADAGCALGTIYKYFEDFDDLVLRVNSNTLRRLDEFLRPEMVGVTKPAEILQALALAYVRFASRNTQLWHALFSYRMADGGAMPDWHTNEHEFMFRLIEGPISELAPHLSEEELAIRTRTVFAATHGVVSFSLEQRFIGVPSEKLEAEVSFLVKGFLLTLEG